MAHIETEVKVERFALHYDETLHFDRTQSERIDQFVSLMKSFKLGAVELFESVNDNAGAIDFIFANEVSIEEFELWRKLIQLQFRASLARA